MVFVSVFVARQPADRFHPCYFDLGGAESLTDTESPMTARLQRGRAARLRRHLNQRELAVLGSLDKLRLLTTSHVQRLHLTDGPSGSNLRRAQYLLRRLHSLNLVVRLPRVVGGRKAGSAGVVYGLSGLGMSVLRSPDDAPQPRRRIWDARPYFQDHMLALSDLYVALNERQRERPDTELLSFAAEPAAWRHFTGAGGELVILKPDAAVQIGLGDLILSAFIEIDLGTETLPTIRRKCERYIAYWRSGVEQHHHGVFPLVVWLVPDERRKANVRRVLDQLSPDAVGLFTVALLEDGPGKLSTIKVLTGGSASRAPP